MLIQKQRTVPLVFAVFNPKSTKFGEVTLHRFPGEPTGRELEEPPNGGCALSTARGYFRAAGGYNRLDCAFQI